MDGLSLLRCTPEEAEHIHSKLIGYDLNYVNDGEQFSYCLQHEGDEIGTAKCKSSLHSRR